MITVNDMSTAALQRRLTELCKPLHIGGPDVDAIMHQRCQEAMAIEQELERREHQRRCIEAAGGRRNA